MVALLRGKIFSGFNYRVVYILPSKWMIVFIYRFLTGISESVAVLF